MSLFVRKLSEAKNIISALTSLAGPYDTIGIVQFEALPTDFIEMAVESNYAPGASQRYLALVSDSEMDPMDTSHIYLKKYIYDQWKSKTWTIPGFNADEPDYDKLKGAANNLPQFDICSILDGKLVPNQSMLDGFASQNAELKARTGVLVTQYTTKWEKMGLQVGVAKADSNAHLKRKEQTVVVLEPLIEMPVGELTSKLVGWFVPGQCPEARINIYEDGTVAAVHMDPASATQVTIIDSHAHLKEKSFAGYAGGGWNWKDVLNASQVTAACLYA